jgi:geranylgeranyl diphosphate synthase type I
MREEMAAGQLLDVAGGVGAPSARVAALKTGSYTAEGPVLIGTALAAVGPAVEGPLRGYARLLGEAFQVRDDVLDGEADARAAERTNELVTRAGACLDGAPLQAEGAAALRQIASALRLDPDGGR